MGSKSLMVGALAFRAMISFQLSSRAIRRVSVSSLGGSATPLTSCLNGTMRRQAAVGAAHAMPPIVPPLNPTEDALWEV